MKLILQVLFPPIPPQLGFIIVPFRTQDISPVPSPFMDVNSSSFSQLKIKTYKIIINVLFILLILSHTVSILASWRIKGFSSDQFGFSDVTVVAYDIDLDNFEGQIFDLVGLENSRNNYGKVTKGGLDVEGRNYSTNFIHTGTLTILHYDKENYTVSVTFEFEAENDLGEKYNTGRKI